MGKQSSSGRAFTLVELLVSMAVLIAIVATMLTLFSSVSKLTQRNTSSVAFFHEARTAFETMNRVLSQAVLNTYIDYDNPSAPSRYQRASELHFVVGSATQITGLSDTTGSAAFFQAPLSLSPTATYKTVPGLLNAVGFYVQFSDEPNLPPFLSGKKAASSAYRLWMFLQPTEKLAVLSKFNGKPQSVSDFSWFQTDVKQPVNNHILASNVVLLLLRAEYPDENGTWKQTYAYDSRSASTPAAGATQAIEIHQLPPRIYVTMAVIDDRTADLLLKVSGGRYDLMPTTGSLFSDASKYAADMQTFVQYLNSRPVKNVPINYRIFETAAGISSSKISR